MRNRWRFAWAWFIAATITGSGCTNIPSKPPGPPEPPPVADPTPVCAPPDLVVACWHMPPGQGWTFIPAPVADLTNCDGPVLDPPLATFHDLDAAVNEAIFRAYQCHTGRCVVNASRFEVQRKIIEELRKAGYCAGQHEPGTSPTSYGSDEIAVSISPTDVRLSHHVVEGPALGPVTILRAPWSARPAYKPAGGVTPAPAPAPAPSPSPTPAPPVPPAGSCTDPLPPRTWTAETLPPGWGSNEIGRPRFEINCTAHGRVIDCTAVVAPRACAYCDAIGMGEYEDSGVDRCGCPVRNECKPLEQTPPQNFKCEERVACEAYLTGGTKLEAKPGATCSFVRGNPFQFEPNDGKCRLCDSTGQVCGGWF